MSQNHSEHHLPSQQTVQAGRLKVLQNYQQFIWNDEIQILHKSVPPNSGAQNIYWELLAFVCQHIGKKYIPWNLQMTNLKKIPLCEKHCFTRRGVGEVWKSFLLNCSPPHNDGQTNSSTFVTSGTTGKKLITSFQQFSTTVSPLLSWEFFITAHLCVMEN